MSADAAGAGRSVQLQGVRVHNLRDVTVSIPLGGMTVVTGVSGAGKSSLALDTLYAESQRRYFQSLAAQARQLLEPAQKPDADHIGGLPPAVAIHQHSLPRNQRVTVGTMTEAYDYLRLLVARAGAIVCGVCGRTVRPSTVADVAAAVAALPAGTRLTVAFPRAVGGDPAAWLARLLEEGFVRFQAGGRVLRADAAAPADLDGDPQPWVLIDRVEAGRVARDRLADSAETAFRFGGGRMALLLDGGPVPFDQRWVCPGCETEYPPLEPRVLDFNDPAGACPACGGTGLAAAGRRSAAPGPCPACAGHRLAPLGADLARLGDRSVAQLLDAEAADLAAWVGALDPAALGAAGAAPVRAQLARRLALLAEVGLGYLTLLRASPTLSVGEAKRVRLARALGSNLVKAMYVLDEPSAGLHPSEVGDLLAVLRRLRGQGNTLVLIEHDAAVLREADHVIDLGPGAGEEGGRVCYEGPPGGLAAAPGSVTAEYLRGGRRIAAPESRRPTRQGHIEVRGANLRNLKDLTVGFPLGVLCAVTGVGGSGKSTLLEDVLYANVHRRLHREGAAPGEGVLVTGVGQIGEVVYMDQQPLPRTARSNPVTYVKAFDEIRGLFAETTEARIRNFDAGTFSFNQPGGRCDVCEGQGHLAVDMQFMADLTVPCPECHGTRYKREVLGVQVRSLNIAQVLGLTVREAFRFFRAQPQVERKLKRLLDVGLDYIRLGQPLETLSGGECQRLKLAGHLASSRKPRCLFLLDEPTAGLHPADVARLLDCFDRLLQAGHSLVVVEHNLDVIQCADWVIDLGPGAGRHGGRVVAAGTPEGVARVPESATGRALAGVLREG